jgi:hypothetical protein
MKVLQIEEFRLTLHFDKELLSQQHREALNPLEIEVIGVKDLPVLGDKTYEAAYVQYRFFQDA